MRKGFTLIELMIVIAIIAIIAAIAIPNLLESRITSNESAAASSLKAGLLPAQTQFQGGNYCDDPSDGTIYGDPTNGAGAVVPAGAGGNGIGDFAGTFNQMCGGEVDYGGLSVVRLTLLPPTWGLNAGANPVVGGALAYGFPVGGAGLGPNVNNYIFTVLAANEIGWASMATPSDGADSIGRRRFAINSGGTVYATAASPTNAEILLTSPTSPFGANVGGMLTIGAAPFNTPTGAQPADSLGGPWAVHKK